MHSIARVKQVTCSIDFKRTISYMYLLVISFYSHSVNRTCVNCEAISSFRTSFVYLLPGSIWQTRDQIIRKMDMFDCRTQDW